MKKSECKRLLEITGDKCNYCKVGKFEIICDIWDDGEKYYYLKCKNCGESFES